MRPERPTKTVKEQLKANDDKMRQSSHKIPCEEDNNCKDQTESVNILPGCPTKLVIKNATVSTYGTAQLQHHTRSQIFLE